MASVQAEWSGLKDVLNVLVKMIPDILEWFHSLVQLNLVAQDMALFIFRLWMKILLRRTA